MKHPRSARLVALGLLVAMSAGACTGDASPGPPGPRSASASTSPPAPSSTAAPVAVTVAFVEALDGGDSAGRVAPAFQAVSLAFANAEVFGNLPVEVDVVTFDIGGDPTRTSEIAAELAADPSVVAAIGAPGLGAQTVLGDALDAAGVPWVSLSGLGSGLGDRGWNGWRRLVADVAAQGSTLARMVDALHASRAGVCAIGDGSRAARSLLGAAVPALRADVLLREVVPEGQTEIAGAASAAAEAGCGVVLWAGEGGLGAALRRQLVEEGLHRVAFVGGDRMRDQDYLDAAGPAAEGTLATCPCVDLSTSTELAAQRFIQDYQAEFGLPPGPYAVEAWDAARLLIDVLRDGATTREEVATGLSATRSFDGLGGVYAFGTGGDLAHPEEAVRRFRVEGGRWIELAPLP